MRGPSTEIFDLVKSMSGPERRFFQLHAHRHVIGEGNNYWRLFALISEQETYDEVALKAAWALHGNPQHFAVIKQQLYQQLLMALHLFHKATSAMEQTKTGLHQVEILIDRGLYQQAEKLLDKQEKLIENNEWLELQAECNRLRHKLWGKQYYKDVNTESLQDLLVHELQSLEQLKVLAETRQKTASLAAKHYSKVGGRAAADINEIDAILVKLPATEGLPLRAQMDVLQANATGQFMKGNVTQAYAFNSQLLLLLEENELLKQYPERYFSTLNNYLVDSQVLGKHNEVLKGLEKLRGLGLDNAFKKIPRLHLNIFRLGYQLELNVCLTAGRFDYAGKLGNEIDAGLKQYAGQIVPHNVITFQYLLGYLHFGNRQWPEALNRMSHIINTEDSNAVQEIQGFARLLNLLVHFEAGHYRLVESLVESVYRYQKQRQQLFETERQFLAFIRKINFIEDRHIREALFRAFLSKMEELKQQPSERRAFDYFDFVVWAKAHLVRKSFSEIWMDHKRV